MAYFFEPNEVNLEVVNRDLTTTEQEMISNHIQAYKAKKQKYAQIAMLTENIEQLTDILTQKENIINPSLLEQYRVKRNDFILQLQEIFISLNLKISIAEA